MDSFEINKFVGAFLFTCLVVMGLGMLSSIIFDSGPPATPGFVIEVAEASTGDAASGAAEEEAPSLPMMLASADAGAGEKVAKKCVSCHSFDNGGKNKVGPNLWNIVGASKAGSDGFAYSDALKGKSGESWGYEELDGFLTAPKKYLPGTSMSFAGLKKGKDRANILAYLQSLSDSPVPFPAAEAGDTANAEEMTDGETEKPAESAN